MNLPNLLSIFRIILIPVSIGLYFSGLAGARLAAGIVIAVAGLTDVLDGYIARRYNMITKLGRILDPLADKMMQAAALTCLTVSKDIPIWVLLIFVAKEIVMGLGGLTMMRKFKNVMPSNILGKIASLYIVLAVIILVTFEGIALTAATVIICIGLGLTLASLIYYLVAYLLISTGKRQIL